MSLSLIERIQKLTREVDANKFTRFAPIFIDEFGRRKNYNVNPITKKYGIPPKYGDLIEVVEFQNHEFSSYYVPISRIRYRKNFIQFELNLAYVKELEKLPPIIDTSIYDKFKTFTASEERKKPFLKDLLDYELILVDGEFKFVDQKIGHVNINSTWPFSMDFVPGKKPYIISNPTFPVVGGFYSHNLIVKAVLHPFYGPANVLVQERKK